MEANKEKPIGSQQKLMQMYVLPRTYSMCDGYNPPFITTEVVRIKRLLRSPKDLEKRCTHPF